MAVSGIVRGLGQLACYTITQIFYATDGEEKTYFTKDMVDNLAEHILKNPQQRKKFMDEKHYKKFEIDAMRSTIPTKKGERSRFGETIGRILSRYSTPGNGALIESQGTVPQENGSYDTIYSITFAGLEAMNKKEFTPKTALQ